MDVPIFLTDNNEQFVASKELIKATCKQVEFAYPGSILKGVQASLKQADNGKLNTYTGIKDMLEAK